MIRFALMTVVATLIIMPKIAPAQTNAGSNAQEVGERVCFIGEVKDSKVFESRLKLCKRGDILEGGWFMTYNAGEICDFTKTIVYNPTRGNVVACVYVGARRPFVQ